MNWVIIGLDNDLSPLQRHIIILIDDHLFPFVHIGKRYNGYLIKMQRLPSKKSHIRISSVNCRANDLNRQCLSAAIN